MFSFRLSDEKKPSSFVITLSGFHCVNKKVVKVDKYKYIKNFKCRQRRIPHFQK